MTDNPEELERHSGLDAYDCGLINDFGGGNVDWWQDYIRAELDRAHDHYAAQVEATAREVEGLRGENEKLRRAVLGIVTATRAYLPPDGISERECISQVLGATDNPEINPIIAEIENGRS